MVAKRFVYF